MELPDDVIEKGTASQSFENDHAYFQNSVDFQITDYDLQRLRTKYSDFNGMITIDEEDFSYIRSNDPAHYYTIEGTSQNPMKANLIQQILDGTPIPVSYENCNFLYEVAEVFELDKLARLSQEYQKHGKINFTCSIFLLKIVYFFYSFFSKLGSFGRFLLTLWDLSGVVVYLGNFLSIACVWASAGISSTSGKIPIFIFIFLPLMLYTFLFANIVSIPIYEFCQFRFFHFNAIFPKVQELISYFISIGFGKPLRKNRLILFSMGRKYPIFLGIIFFVFVLLLLLQLFSDQAIKGVEFFLLVFITVLPFVRYTLIFILYWILCILSLFNTPKKRFLRLGIYDDPFLCAIFLRRKYWFELFGKWKKKTTKKAHFFLVVNAIFCKATASIYVIVAFSIFMGINSSQSEKKIGAGPIAVTIFILYMIVELLCCSISFPFIWWRRIAHKKKTASQLNHEFESIDINSDPEVYEKSIAKWMEDEICYRRKNNVVRWVSLCTSVLFFVVIIIVAIVAVSPDPSYIPYSPHSQAKLLDAFFSANSSQSYAQLLSSLAFSETSSPNDPTRKNPTTHFLAQNNHYNHDNHNNHYNRNNQNNENNEKNPITHFLAQNNHNNRNKQNNGKNLRTKFLAENAKILQTYALYERQKTKQVQSFCNARVKNQKIAQTIALAISAGKEGEEQSLLLKTFYPNDTIIEMKTRFDQKTNGLFIRHYRVPADHLSIVSIRGTRSMRDSLCDVDMWASTVVVDIAAPFIPFFDYPSSFVRVITGVLMALPRYAFRQLSLADSYVDQIEDFINDLKAEKTGFPEDEVLIVGHSLGGGLAKILSLRTGYNSVALSGPGIKTVQWFYEKGFPNIENALTDVTPDQDIVARVDRETAGQYRVPCEKGMFSCHNGPRTLCEMGIMCGELQADYCKHYFSDKELARMIKLGQPVERA